jgi:hypothetical protein
MPVPAIRREAPRRVRDSSVNPLPVIRRPALRLTTACLVVLSLLFSQLALAAYACPQADDPAMAAMRAAGMPCAGMDAEQPALCAEHAAPTAQSFEAVKVPAPSAPAIVQVLELPLVPDAAQAVAIPRTARPETRPPPDPVFLATLRLRV